MQKPLYLYKYFSFSAQSLLNLKGRVIYFGSPLGFNDPFDCAVSPLIESPSDDEVVKLRDSVIHSSNMSREFIEKLKQEDLNVVRDTLIQGAKIALAIESKKFAAQRGVSCFSERKDDLLMWSLYGGVYKGFCLEFSGHAEIFSKARKVHYPPTPPVVSVSSLLLPSELNVYETLFYIKPEDWEHEEEWRVVHAKVKTEVVYNSGDLTGVYFGSEIDLRSIELVRLIVESEHADVRFWKGRRSKTEFRMLFDELH